MSSLVSVFASNKKRFQLESGSFETLIKLSNEGLGMTLLPYLHTLDLSEKENKNLRMFEEPSPAREVSLIYHKSELKMQIIEALDRRIILPSFYFFKKPDTSTCKTYD